MDTWALQFVQIANRKPGEVITRSVEFRKYQMMEELGIKSTAELVRFAVKTRIVAT